MYSIIDSTWVILASTIILVCCFVYQIYEEHKFVLLDVELNYGMDENHILLPEVLNPNEISFKAIHKTMAYYIREKLHTFILGVILILLYSILFPFISSNLCIGVYDESEGLMFNTTVVSTFFSRHLDADI